MAEEKKASEVVPDFDEEGNMLNLSDASFDLSGLDGPLFGGELPHTPPSTLAAVLILCTVGVISRGILPGKVLPGG
ncbi:unnamed protein product [Linum trigynum]|uniref:Uncharacterized protein n=1 Tax=Linum trigynum TaxID=586398 RepID=A0AAV2DTY3_9ROSI